MSEILRTEHIVQRFGGMEALKDISMRVESGEIHYMISTSAKGRLPARDSVKMRRKSVERSICCLTAIDTAKALANVLESGRSIDDVEMVDITKI